MQMIITSECENCIYSTIYDEDKARIKVHCNIKDKTYYYGQCIPCEFKEARKNKKENIDNEENSKI